MVSSQRQSLWDSIWGNSPHVLIAVNSISPLKLTWPQGKEIGVQSTPTFFVNGKMVSGARDIDYFSEIIDEELN